MSYTLNKVFKLLITLLNALLIANAFHMTERETNNKISITISLTSLVALLMTSVILIKRSGYFTNSSKNDSVFKVLHCNPTKPDKLNVHIISHTHLDAGWVKTYDQYYTENVIDIMNSVIKALSNGNGMDSRLFTFVEMCYFSRYWNSVNTTEKNVIRELVTKGKLQFTSGGWVMNDEATPHYSMIIDQMSYGHRWISRTFGPQFIPSTGWQIDPFGHTKEFASILSQMGFNALFLGRIDFQDKQKRMSDKSMEFIWKTDQSLRQNNYLMTGITPSGYYPTDGVCVDCYYTTNSPNLLSQVNNQTPSYRTNHLMATMGGDFAFNYAEYSFTNLDQLINYTNHIQNDTHLLYSTPDCYAKALYDSDIEWTDDKVDDFMPYADRMNDYWSGYFTSRPTLKYLMNYANSVLQVCKQLIAISNISSKGTQLIQPLEEAVGIGLHHDAISGTSKQFVANDYIQMLSNGLAVSEEVISIAYQKLFKTEIKPQFCHNFNTSECLYLDRNNGFPTKIAIYNPLAQRVPHYIRLPLIDTNYQIFDSNGKVIESQIVLIPEFIQTLSERKSEAKYELIFEAVLEPLTFNHYYLNNLLIARQTPGPLKPIVGNEVEDVIIGNQNLKAIIDSTTGLLKAINTKGFFIPIKQNFGYYTYGTYKYSGAYALHTQGPKSYIITNTASISVIKGNVSEEVIQEFTPWLKQVIRVYKNSDHLEFEWTVGPLPNETDIEVISNFKTGFRNREKFYTDSNGRQTQERIRDYRQTWDLLTNESVASNYYPISSWIFIRDLLTNLQMTVLPDRTQGGSSLEDGSIELMIHRRLHYDDSYGVEEALNEPGVDGNGLVVRGKHILLIDTIEESLKKIKVLSKRLFWKPLPLFFPIESTTDTSANSMVFMKPIHPFVHLLTFEELEENVLFIRLEYILEINETKETTVSIQLNQLFPNIKIVEVIETGLSGAEPLADMMSKKYKWDCSQCPNDWEALKYSDTLVTLNSNQIRSFILIVKRVDINAKNIY